MKQLKDTFEFRSYPARARLVSQLIRQYNHHPRNSVTALIRKAGPFVVSRDAFAFPNGGWPITQEDAQILRERYRTLVDGISVLGIAQIRLALNALRVSPPIGPTISLPVTLIDFVINEVTGKLRDALFDLIVSSTPGKYGRCGGLAFSAYDFYQTGWPIDTFQRPAPGTDLSKYIWNRLLDSLELNAATFLDWIMVLHVLPVISRLASASLASGAGLIVGGPLGSAIGALVGGGTDVLGVGGADVLLDRTKEHLEQLKKRLNEAAACPIGFVYGDSPNPVDNHQVLAIGYENSNPPVLKIWDNNDLPSFRRLTIDMSGKELTVRDISATNRTYPSYKQIKGIICEQYTYKEPPVTLRTNNKQPNLATLNSPLRNDMQGIAP